MVFFNKTRALVFGIGFILIEAGRRFIWYGLDNP